MLLFLLFLGGPVTGQDKITLFDLISPFSTQRQFDTLSSVVSSEYSGRTISFDASTLPKFEERPVNISKLNSRYRDYLYQGDMVIHPDRLNEIVDSSLKRKKRKAFVNRDYPKTIWQKGVPYSLHWTLTSAARDSILRAINFWEQETCIDFFPRTNQLQYVEFIGNDDGCWSTVGKDSQLGRQVVSIGSGCEHFGVTSHELAHALGVFHEQSRYDRDAYVSLNPNVVDRSLLFNFAKISSKELSLYNLPYDVGSVMHYTPTEFSRVRGVPALTTVDPNLQQTMGQMEGPSFLDVAVMNLHYQCPNRCSRQFPCKNGGIIDSRTCNKCKCPTGFGGTYCENVPPSFSKGCGGIIQVEEAVRRFEITIRQNDIETKEKQCNYQLVAPAGKKILLNLLKMQARCVEGCWMDGAEFKMLKDFRPVGYRIATQKKLLSQTNIVPLIITSRNNTMNLIFEYTSVDTRTRFDATVDTSSQQPDFEVLESIDEEEITTTIHRTKKWIS